jgi:hypothetical protein
VSVLLAVLAVPVELGREAAREAAAEELARQVYRQARPSLTERVLRWAYERLNWLTDQLATVSPVGYTGLAMIVLLVVVAVVAVRLKVGRFGRAASSEGALFVGGPRSAESHRKAADAHAAAGDWAEAVRERLRAVIRSLEERSLLDHRPGRTADEAAAEAGQALPHCGAALGSAARVFDEIWYGGRPATAESDRVLRDLDRRVQESRPVLARGAR